MADAREKYKDIIDLPHHVSDKRPHMSPRDRAGQFSPFAALTGFDDSIEETGRYTDSRLFTDEDDMAEIGRKLKILEDVGKGQTVKVTYFVPDLKKEGGAYRTVESAVRKVKVFERALILEDGNEIGFDDISALESDLFSENNREKTDKY